MKIKSIIDSTITPTSYSSKYGQSSSTSIVYNIKIIYLHTYTVTKTHVDKVDIPTFLQSFIHHTLIESPSQID